MESDGFINIFSDFKSDQMISIEDFIKRKPDLILYPQEVYHSNSIFLNRLKSQIPESIFLPIHNKKYNWYENIFLRS